MKWILLLTILGDTARNESAGLVKRIYAGQKPFHSQLACAKARQKYESDGFTTFCVKGPLQVQTVEQWNAAHPRGVQP